jgi:hypothetical protein
LSEDFNLTQALMELFKAHGLRASVEDGRVSVDSPSPLVFAWEVHEAPQRPDKTMVQLNIATHSPISAKPVWHAFAGIAGDRPAAEREAFGKFVMGPFHTLLSAFGNHSCPADGTEWSDMRSQYVAWRVCDSPLLVQGGDPVEVGYAEFFKQLRERFISGAAPGVHWCEVFFASLDGQPLAADVHLDNERWPEASQALAHWHRPLPIGYRSARHFFVALPA